jgi:TonB family protein
MRQLRLLLALILVFANPCCAQQQFNEPKLANAGEVVHPFNSAAYGTVAMDVLVARSGRVKSVRVTRDVRSLTSEAVREVRAWTFKPATIGGAPTESDAAVVLVFNPPFYNPSQHTLPPETHRSDETGGESSFSPPQLMEVIYPQYPIRSIERGTVVLEVEVDSSGGVGMVRVVRGIQTLTAGAIQAARAWKFLPATMDNKNMRSTVTVAILFTLPGGIS